MIFSDEHFVSLDKSDFLNYELIVWKSLCPVCLVVDSLFILNQGLFSYFFFLVFWLDCGQCRHSMGCLFFISVFIVAFPFQTHFNPLMSSRTGSFTSETLDSVWKSLFFFITVASDAILHKMRCCRSLSVAIDAVLQQLHVAVDAVLQWCGPQSAAALGSVCGRCVYTGMFGWFALCLFGFWGNGTT